MGRAEELRKLRNRLDAAAGGAPQVVLVDGPAGIGKTSLARRFLSGAAADCRVLKAGGDELETELAYGLVAQLVPHLPAAAEALRSRPSAHPTAPPRRTRSLSAPCCSTPWGSSRGERRSSC